MRAVYAVLIGTSIYSARHRFNHMKDDAWNNRHRIKVWITDMSIYKKFAAKTVNISA